MLTKLNIKIDLNHILVLWYFLDSAVNIFCESKMMVELKNNPPSNLHHLNTNSVADSSADKKALTLKWISIIAYLVILIGSLFTF